MMDHANPLNDAMPPRTLVARWVILGTLVLESAVHLGGEGSASVDMPVLRDARAGVPLLPGTTFTGALRGALADRLAGYAKAEPPAVSALFGGARGDEVGSQSPLIVFDALGELPPASAIEIRDGVAISPATGTAEEHKKYDFEVLPAGTRFPVRVDLLLPPPPSGGGRQSFDERALLGALASALDAFSNGEGSLGARRSRGLGRVRATWQVRRFDLTTGDGWLAWLTCDLSPDSMGESRSASLKVLNDSAPAALRPLALPADERERIVITAKLIPKHDLLLRSPGTKPNDPDVVYLQSGGEPILPGTSIAGVVRAQALRIAQLVRGEKGDAEQWVNSIFGPRFEGQRPLPGTSPIASRLRISETRLVGASPAQQTRIAIDRFTQGVVDSALFDEGTSVGGSAEVTVELRNPQDSELGLVLLVLKDLLDGWLPVGGTSSVGRGVFHGSAEVAFHLGNGAAPLIATIEPGKPPTGTAAHKIDEVILAFRDAAVLPSGEGDARSEVTA